MRLHRLAPGLALLVVMAFVAGIHAQSAPAGAANPQTGGREAGAGRAGGAPGARGATTGERTPIPGSNEPPKLIFHEAWTRAPMAQPITQANLGNQNLTLHIYGNA